MKSKELIEKSLKKNSTQQLVSKIEKLNSSSVEFEVIVSILEKRNFDVSKWKVETSIDQVSESIKDEIHEIIKKESIDLTPTLRDKLIEDVDHLVDELIASKRTVVYTEVMKALGGQYDSDIDELFEKATEEQLREALTFKNFKKEISKVDSLIAKGKELKIKEPKIETPKPSVNKTKKSIILEESEEIKGLKVDSKVEFKAAPTSKLSNKVLNGVVISVYKCHKSNFKEYCKISFDGNIFYKRSNSLKLV